MNINPVLRGLRQEYEDLMKQGHIDAAHEVLAQRDRLLIAELVAAAREAVEMWQAGPSMYDADEFGTAMDNLARALPPKHS
jgi:hypothetical protein